MEYEIGIPHTIGFLRILEIEKDITILSTFTNRVMVKYLKIFISNFLLNFSCEDKQLNLIVKDKFKASLKNDLA